MYYADKLEVLRDLFGDQDVEIQPNVLRVGTRRFPVVDDVIVLSPPDQYSPQVRAVLASTTGSRASSDFAEDIQFTFGEEWKSYGAILPEHRDEFDKYFDLVDLAELANARVCDLGCGSGRWSHFVKDYCKELVLVDFSDAIFVARKNLRDSPNALFFQCDLRNVPFRADFADFLFCLGVLHHLPTPCLDEVRALRRHAAKVLVYLYYALDNRPPHFRVLLKGVTATRAALSRVRSSTVRKGLSYAGTLGIYYPLIVLGKLAQPLGFGSHVPLYEAYHDKSFRRLEQDVYDRFFTRIEQRVSRKQILELADTFSRVTVSPHLPYWHFVCER